MFGPGKYVLDPTESIIDVQNLPAPQIVAYDRNHEHTPAFDVAISAIAINGATARYTTWAICLPVAPLTSW